MTSITFRFTTECEMTLTGKSYEDAYMKFKDFMHGDSKIQEEALLRVCTPESDQLFFSLDQQYKMYEIAYFKGSYKQDIEARSEYAVITPADLGDTAMWSGAQPERMRSVHNPG